MNRKTKHKMKRKVIVLFVLFSLFPYVFFGGCDFFDLNAGSSQSVSFTTDMGILEFTRSGNTIRIPAGTYNVKSGYKKAFHIYLHGLKDVTIDATGVVFIFEDKFIDGLLVEKCANITIKGATFYYKQKIFTQGIITQVGLDHVNFRLDDGYPEPVEIDDGNRNYIMCGIVYGKNGVIKPGTVDLYNSDNRVEPLSGGEYRLDCGNTVNISVGDRIALRKGVSRTIITAGSEAVTFDGVQVLSGGIAFQEDSGAGGHIYKNCLVKPLDKNDLISTAADAFHSTNVETGPLIENCTFEKMGDDGANIHGRLYHVSTGGKKIFTVDNDQWTESFKTGDTIRVYRNGVELDTPALKVTAVSRLRNGNFRVTVDGEAVFSNGDLVFTPNRVGAGFVIKNTTVRNNRARGFLIKSRDGTITGCTIEGSSMYAILIDAELNNEWMWMESMYAENITISDCLIKNVNYNGYTSSQADVIVHPNTKNITITNLRQQ